MRSAKFDCNAIRKEIGLGNCPSSYNRLFYLQKFRPFLVCKLEIGQKGFSYTSAETVDVTETATIE